jgi:hypothetical protein
MEFKVRDIGFVALGLGAVYLAYRLINNGFSYAAKYPRLYALVTRGESKTYNDYNFYTVSGLKSNVDGKGSKYPLLNRALSSYTVGAIKKMQAEPKTTSFKQVFLGLGLAVVFGFIKALMRVGTPYVTRLFIPKMNW